MIAKYIMLSSSLFFTTFAFSNQNHEHVSAGAQKHHHSEAYVSIDDAKIRAFLPAAKSTAAYFTLENKRDTKLTLVKATISGLGRVEIHEHVHHNGMMKMQQVDKLVIKAKTQVKFQPGGYHLMAFEPKSALTTGEKRKLTLHFANGEQVFTQIHVVSLKDSFKKVKNAHHHHEE
ncbi:MULTISPECIES: copper chaperone PCu(A)C [Pseudoalteromonas]|uniref:Copper chaperone n=1 Tax=Pseudoalteromonas aurantia 208 TaxID=1314867 RepID=A0ABR9EDZ6_9GAMM|nr:MULTISPECIES: copper chaperone PCu(A)C [Pseudoalteromonas]MBE0369211.1 hypothetical protein [Pseudoalteromonas aurantia 208]MBQ4849183.1 copper chaperone PCu(A)C [Pseudoalteromonas sp. MMG012]